MQSNTVIPFDDIELECLQLYKNNIIQNDNEIDNLIKNIPKEKDKAKKLVKELKARNIKTQSELFDLINKTKHQETEKFINSLTAFLD